MRHRVKARYAFYKHVIKANIYNRLGFLTYPYAAHFIPTWRCNLKCKTCNIWKRVSNEELSTKDMVRVIRGLKCLDIIKIVGGEPFLREDLDILIKEIREAINPFVLQIITNGICSDRILEFINRTGYEAVHLRVSIDGIGKRHDAMRGVEGAFDRAYVTLEKLVKLRELKKFVLGVNFNVTDETLPDMGEVIKLCGSLNVDFIPGIPVTPFLEDVDFSKVSFRTVNFNNKNLFPEKYIKMKKRGVNFLEGLFLIKANKDVFSRFRADNINLKFSCRELRNLIYIHTNADIVTCGLKHKKVGNLLEESLADIWFGERIKLFREEVDKCAGCLQGAVEILSKVYYWR